MVPVVSDGVFPRVEDGLGGNEGEEGRGRREHGKEGMESETFMGEERMADAVLFKVSAEILVFGEEQSKEGETAVFCGKEEKEPGKEG
jgi:hypothetical protein